MGENIRLVPNFLRVVGVNTGEISSTKEGLRVVGSIDNVLGVSIKAEIVGDMVTFEVKNRNKVLQKGRVNYAGTVMSIREPLIPIMRKLGEEYGVDNYNKKRHEYNREIKDGTGLFYDLVLSTLFQGGVVKDVKEAFTVKFGGCKVIAYLDDTKIIYDFEDRYNVVNVKWSNGRLYKQGTLADLAHITREMLYKKEVEPIEILKHVEKLLRDWGIMAYTKGTQVDTKNAIITVSKESIKVTSRIGGSITTPINQFDIKTIDNALLGNKRLL